MISHTSMLPLLIGHRGIPEFAPENSIMGALIAKTMNISCIEVDAMLCKDNNVVIHHDFDLKRTVGNHGLIKDFNYQELREFDIINKFKFEGTEPVKIPHMRDMIIKCNEIDIMLNIEIKCEDNDLQVANTVCKQIRKHGNQKNIIVSSFNVSILELAKKIIPTYERNYIVDKIPKDWLIKMSELGCTSLIVSYKHNSFEEIINLLKYGISIYVFTINDVETYRKFNALGIGVFSDKPYTLQKYK